MLHMCEGNLVTDPYDIICHQVNCQGVMGSGIAKQIKANYPSVYYVYKQQCDRAHNKMDLLGGILAWPCRDKVVVSLFGQYRYGRKPEIYTDYEAFKRCLDKLKIYLKEMPLERKIAFPYKIGCGLGGGDWNTIYKMLAEFADNIKQDVYIVKLPEEKE